MGREGTKRTRTPAETYSVRRCRCSASSDRIRATSGNRRLGRRLLDQPLFQRSTRRGGENSDTPAGFAQHAPVFGRCLGRFRNDAQKIQSAAAACPSEYMDFKSSMRRGRCARSPSVPVPAPGVSGQIAGIASVAPPPKRVLSFPAQLARSPSPPGCRALRKFSGGNVARAASSSALNFGWPSSTT